MTSNQNAAGGPHEIPFYRTWPAALELSEMLPNLGRVADELCVVRSIHSEAINHDPAITFLQTGFQLSAGRASARGFRTVSVR